jgi:hypothetical protein
MKIIEIGTKQKFWLEFHGNVAVLCGKNYQSLLGLVNLKKLSITSLPCCCGECMSIKFLEAVEIISTSRGMRYLVLDSIDDEYYVNIQVKREFIDKKNGIFVVKIGRQKLIEEKISSRSKMLKYLLIQTKFLDYKDAQGNRELLHELLKITNI